VKARCERDNCGEHDRNGSPQVRLEQKPYTTLSTVSWYGRRVNRAPIIFAFAALTLGVVAADAARLSASDCATAFFVLLLILAVAVWRRTGVALAALGSLLAAGAFSTAVQSQPAPHVAACASEMWRAEVAGPIERVVDAASGDIWQKTDIELLGQLCAGVWRGQQGRVRATFSSGPNLVRGDVVQAQMQLLPFTAPRNPSDLDMRVWARQHNLGGRARVRSEHVIVKVGTGPWAWLDATRTDVAHRLERVMQREHAAIAKAISMGDRGGILPEQRDDWARAGVAHLLAISGLHVGIVAALVFFLSRILLGWFPGSAECFSTRKVAALIAIPAAIVFCVWAGAPASAVRATVMACAFMLGLALSRPSNAVNALGLAGAGILLLVPTSLYDPGFLLSFAAVAALLLLPRLPKSRGVVHSIGRAVRDSVLASLAATLATAPVSAHAFGSVSLLAPFANVLAVPVTTLVVTPLCLVFAVLAGLGGWVESALGYVLDAVVGLLSMFAHGVGGLRFAAVNVPQPNVIETVAYVGLLLSGAIFIKTRNRAWIAGFVALVVLLGSAGWRIVGRMGDGTLTVLHPYVGQGESTILILPEGGVVVYDAGGAERAGGRDPGRDVVGPLLRQRGIYTIDLAVFSHPHPDHVGGFEYIVEHFDIAEVWHNGARDELVHRLLLKLRDGTESRVAAALPSKIVREGVVFEVLHPRPTDGEATFGSLNTNDNSMVLRVSYGERSLLLPGDLGVDAEPLIIGSLSPTDILKAGHHGSQTASSDEFLQVLRPMVGVISCGEANRYGLPDEIVLERYREHGMRVLRTDIDGMVQMRTEGKTWQISTQCGTEITLPTPSPSPSG